MYVPENYENYKYVVSYHDNYVVLTNRRSVTASWDNVQNVPVIYQYFVPSIYTFPSVSSFSSSRTFEEIEVSSDYYDRADCPQLTTCILGIIFFVLFILNGITKFVKKGGIFFGQ